MDVETLAKELWAAYYGPPGPVRPPDAPQRWLAVASRAIELLTPKETAKE